MIAPSRRTMTSEIALRRIRLRVAAVAAGCNQAHARSAPSAMSFCRSGSPSGGGRRATMAAMSPSILATACRASFHSALQLAGDEPIGWINSIVLLTGIGDLIAGLLQGEFQLPLSRRGLARLGFDRLDRRLYTEWLQNSQHLLGDRCVDAQATH